MRKKTLDLNAQFLPYRGAAEVSGLSVKHIRDGCINGRYPYIKVGRDVRVNMPLFLDILNKESLSQNEQH